MSDIVLDLRGVERVYAQGENRLPVLNGVNLSVRAGEMVALVGPSGCGKTTLLQIAGLLDAPTGGSVFVAGEDMRGAGEARRTLARRRGIGFVYQFHHLLPDFTALENVALPQMIAGASRGAADLRGNELLAALGLSARASHRPARLSGGEQQRTAIARALAASPKLLLADEPTGNLDPHTAEEVFACLVKMARESGAGALVATHNHELARRMDRIVQLHEGKIRAGGI